MRPHELIHAVRVVAAGNALIVPPTTRRLIAEFAHDEIRTSHQPPSLT